MIVGSLKDLEKIIEMLSSFQQVLVLGCGGCVTVCQTGGAQEAEVLAKLLSMDRPEVSFRCLTVPRQCEWEFLEVIAGEVGQSEAILSLACGIGVQALNDYFPALPALPALNTEFLGMPVRHGQFEERCQACGDCMLHLTGGICPISRCSKSLMNGPCGGSQNGKCEISSDVECAWQLIYDRLGKLGRLDNLLEIQAPRDWSLSRDGGPRKMTREDLVLNGEE